MFPTSIEKRYKKAVTNTPGIRRALSNNLLLSLIPVRP